MWSPERHGKRPELSSETCVIAAIRFFGIIQVLLSLVCSVRAGGKETEGESVGGAGRSGAAQRPRELPFSRLTSEGASDSFSETSRTSPGVQAKLYCHPRRCAPPPEPQHLSDIHASLSSTSSRDKSDKHASDELGSRALE